MISSNQLQALGLETMILIKAHVNHSHHLQITGHHVLESSSIPSPTLC